VAIRVANTAAVLLIVRRYLNRAGGLPAWFVDPPIEQAVESAIEHGEQNSHISLPPQQIRDILNRISARVQQPETPVVAITYSGARYFLRQLAEPTLPDLFFLAHNEVPPGLRVQSLGNLQ
jgi:flagellar biosynthesis protein FlhA